MPVVKNSKFDSDCFASYLVNFVIFAVVFCATSWTFSFASTRQPSAKLTSYFPPSQTEVPFYRSPESEFPSGLLSIDRLEKNADPISTVKNPELNVKYKNQNIQKSGVRFSTAHDLRDIYHVGDPKRDLGLFEITVETHLFKSPNRFSKKILKLVPGQKLKSEFTESKFKNGFVKIRLGSAVGFVDLSHTISKYDFAVWVYPKGASPKSSTNGWEQVESRIFDEIKLKSQRIISMNEIEGIWTDPTRAIATTASSEVPLWSILKIETEQPIVWRKSRVSGHGTVWWKETKTKNAQPGSSHITIDELLKRKISSVSFHPKDSKKAIVSANGVFRTTDGVIWEKLHQFEGFSGPVYYYNDSLIFIGHYRSIDRGQTFEPYIKISELSKTIADFTGFQPERLELKSIKTKGAYRLVLGVHIGTKELHVQSPLYTQNWTVLPEPKTVLR